MHQELDEGFYWVQIEGDSPEIGWYDEVTDGWWTTSSESEIPARNTDVYVLSTRLTYNEEEHTNADRT